MTCLVDVCAFDWIKKDRAATELHNVPHTSIQIPRDVWCFRFLFWGVQIPNLRCLVVVCVMSFSEAGGNGHYLPMTDPWDWYIYLH